jgi:ribose/xylose/arabinose/galactoside ABC-type transport system permease subunit
VTPAWDPAWAIVPGTLAGLVVGLCNGLLITWLGIDPFITALAMLSVVRGVVSIVSNQYNVNIADNSGFLALGWGHLGVIPISVPIFAGLFVVAWFAGAAHDDRAGAPCPGVRTVTYAISGACAALSG